MKKMYNLLIIKTLFFLFLLNACTINEVGPPGQNGVSDKQIRFPLGNNIGTELTTPQATDSQFDLIKFDKRNYVSVDSIVFSSRMRVSDGADSCIVELFNVTDNQVITSSKIRTNATTFTWQDSPNLYSNLPSKQITLAVRVRSKIGKSVEGGQSFLFLYRD
jgi:hypothetical protein